MSASKSDRSSAPATARVRLVALVGNPNTGKTTLFNALTGFRAHTGNYPGVTVEKKHGPILGRRERRTARPAGDLQPRRALSRRMVAVDVLLGRRADTARPDAVVIVVDASNLERNLYLATQVLESGVPAILALNMSDTAAARGVRIDAAELSRRLGVPVVPLVAHRREGVPELARAIAARLSEAGPAAPTVGFPPDVEREITGLRAELTRVFGVEIGASEALRVLFDVDGAAPSARDRAGRGRHGARRSRTRARVSRPAERGSIGLEAALRYGAIERLTSGRGDDRGPDRPHVDRSHRRGRDAPGARRAGLRDGHDHGLPRDLPWASPLMDFLNDERLRSARVPGSARAACSAGARSRASSSRA